MAEFPKPLKPMFEYETKDEWVDLMSKQQNLNIEPKLMDCDEDILVAKQRKKTYQEMLDTDLAESDDKKKIEQMIQEKMEKDIGGPIKNVN